MAHPTGAQSFARGLADDARMPGAGRAGAEVLSGSPAGPHRALRCARCTERMPDVLVTLFLAAAILLVADLLLAGGAMTMAGMSAMVGAVAHPLGLGALAVLVLVLFLVLGGQG